MRPPPARVPQSWFLPRGRQVHKMRGGLSALPEKNMTLEQYNESIKKIVAEQQKIAQSTAQLAMSGQANPTNPQFVELMSSQWALLQQIAKLNTELMMGVMAPKK
jgi:hypothetical protein